jgi:hypothetical protein
MWYYIALLFISLLNILLFSPICIRLQLLKGSLNPAGIINLIKRVAGIVDLCSLFYEFSMGVKKNLFTVASLKLLENIRSLLRWLLRSCTFGGVLWLPCRCRTLDKAKNEVGGWTSRIWS